MMKLELSLRCSLQCTVCGECIDDECDTAAAVALFGAVAFSVCTCGRDMTYQRREMTKKEEHAYRGRWLRRMREKKA